MIKANIDALPFQHPDLKNWRLSLRGGISHTCPSSGVHVHGAIDDLWESSTGDIHVVDYKVTMRYQPPSLEEPQYVRYKRQVEIYQWLAAKNGLSISSCAYFLFVVFDINRLGFGGRMHFTFEVIPYEGDSRWVDCALESMHRILAAESLPNAQKECSRCSYFHRRLALEGDRKINPSKIYIKRKLH
jgi:hypothetical protein